MWLPFNAKKGYLGVTSIEYPIEINWSGHVDGVEKKKKLVIRSDEEAKQLISDLQEKID